MDDTAAPADAEEIRSIPEKVALAGASREPADQRAEREEDQLGRGDSETGLKLKARLADFKRGETFRDHFELLAILTMWIIFGAMLVLGVIWLLHMILPETCGQLIPVCRWLRADEVTVIQDILTGGLIAGLIADHFKRRMIH